MTEELQQYIASHQIEDRLQTALDSIISSRSKDPFGRLSEIFKKYANPPIIHSLIGREVLDSRGIPTIEIDVYVLYLGEVIFAGRSSSPSGASTELESKELRDGDKRYLGNGVQKAIAVVNSTLSSAMKGMKIEATNLKFLDDKICEIDGTEHKENIGGNVCTATSFALAEASAYLFEEDLFIFFSRLFLKKIPERYKLPSPYFNVLNGGKHYKCNLKVQEFMLVPSKKFCYPDQLRVASEIYQHLGSILVKKYGISARNLSDHGGFAPNLETPDEALNVIEEAVRDAGYVEGDDVSIAIDCGADEFFDTRSQKYEIENGKLLTSDDLIKYYQALVKKHKAIISIEDPLHFNDYDGWIKLTRELGENIQIVGDHLYSSNPKTIALSVEEEKSGKWSNALLLKVNQIGTITEAMEAAKLAFQANQHVIVSARTGETCSSLIADLAVGIGANGIKSGSCARGEHMQKYTRLLQIYDFLKEKGLLSVE